MPRWRRWKPSGRGSKLLRNDVHWLVTTKPAKRIEEPRKNCRFCASVAIFDTLRVLVVTMPRMSYARGVLLTALAALTFVTLLITSPSRRSVHRPARRRCTGDRPAHAHRAGRRLLRRAGDARPGALRAALRRLPRPGAGGRVSAGADRRPVHEQVPDGAALGALHPDSLCDAASAGGPNARSGAAAAAPPAADHRRCASPS